MTRRVIEIEPGYGSRSYTGKQSYKSQPVIKEYTSPQPVVRTDHHDEPAIPLEMLPVIRTLMGYGKRTHALGALRGARALERVVDNLMPHIRKFPELVDVVLEAKHEAEAIRAEAIRNADGEQREEEDQG